MIREKVKRKLLYYLLTSFFIKEKGISQTTLRINIEKWSIEPATEKAVGTLW